MLREPRVGREVVVDHALPLGVHDARVSAAASHHLERATEVEAERLGKCKSLGERRAVKPKDQVGHQFHLGPSARRSGVKGLSSDCGEQIRAGFKRL